MRMLAVTYYGKRHLTTGTKEVKTVADMAGFKLRVPPVDTFRAMAEAWGAQGHADQLQRALSRAEPGRRGRPGEPAADDRQRQAERGAEIPGADRPHHHAAPGHRQRGGARRRSIPPTAQSSTRRSPRASTWQDAELSNQEGTLIDTLKSAGMTVIEPDVESFRKPVLDQVPPKFEEKWGKGTWDALAAL